MEIPHLVKRDAHINRSRLAVIKYLKTSSSWRSQNSTKGRFRDTIDVCSRRYGCAGLGHFYRQSRSAYIEFSECFVR